MARFPSPTAAHSTIVSPRAVRITAAAFAPNPRTAAAGSGRARSSRTGARTGAALALRMAMTAALAALVGGAFTAHAAPPPPPPPAGAPPPPPPSDTSSAPTCSEPSGVCLDGPKGAQFKVGKRTSAKARKARGKGAPGTWSVQLDGGRASVFLDGRWLAEAPLRDASIPAGSHDFEVRDGTGVLARGELIVPKGAELTLVIHHPAPAAE